MYSRTTAMILAYTFFCVCCLPSKAQTSSEREEALLRATQSVAKAVPRAQADTTRPLFHFRPPAQWMNDPNGTIYHDGYFHVFYQHNPYGDKWGHMHWGHTRSKDLVHWEHLPIALWPSLKQGEEHVFSGCAWRGKDNQVRLYYTSVGPDRPNQQWLAVSRQKSLMEWDKHTANPFLTTKQPDGLTFDSGMRDPFIFDAEGRTLMVIGADVEGEAVIPIYEADDNSLTNWKYRGIMWRAPKSVMKFPECPNFFRVDDRWLLLTSPYRPVEYRVGKFDLATLKFTPDGEGKIDATDRFYATNIAYNDQQRCILFGWIRGFPENRGWNGCLALPRELTIDPNGHPRQQPVRELSLLRKEHYGEKDIVLKPESPIIQSDVGDTLEIQATLALGTAKSCGFKLQRSANGDRGTVISYHGTYLSVAGEDYSLPKTHQPGNLDVHIYLDKSVLEVFADEGRVCITRIVSAIDGDVGAELFAAGGTATIQSLDAWQLKPIWNSQNSLPYQEGPN